MTPTLQKWGRWIPVTISALTLVGSMLWALGAAVGDAAASRAAVQMQAGMVHDHEQRLRDIERELPAIAENVRITRAAVERIEDRLGGGP